MKTTVGSPVPQREENGTAYPSEVTCSGHGFKIKLNNLQMDVHIDKPPIQVSDTLKVSVTLKLKHLMETKLINLMLITATQNPSDL